MYCRVLFLLSITLFGIRCSASDPSELIDLFGSRGFWALRIRSNSTSSYQVPAVFLAESEHAQVYVSFDTDDVTKGLAEKVLSAFESNVKPIESTFGPPPDVDGNGKVILLFLDIDDGAKSGDAYIAGYFSPYDQYSDSSVRTQFCNSTICYRSNESDILYLDTYPARPDSIDFLATMAHEYQHMLHFEHDYNAFLADPNAKTEATWVNEGLSETASDVAGYGPQTSRLSYYQNTAGNSLIGWSNTLEDYANTYVYFRFLADVYGNGVLTSIFRSNEVSVPGVNAGINGFATINYADCGTSFPHGYASFDCLYRLEQSAIYGLNNVSGQFDSTAITTFVRAAKYNFTNAPTAPPTQAESSPLAVSNYAALGLNSIGLGVTPSTGFASLYQVSKNTGVLYNHSTSDTITTKTGTVGSISGKKCYSLHLPGTALPGLGARLSP